MSIGIMHATTSTASFDVVLKACKSLEPITGKSNSPASFSESWQVSLSKQRKANWVVSPTTTCAVFYCWLSTLLPFSHPLRLVWPFLLRRRCVTFRSTENTRLAKYPVIHTSANTPLIWLQLMELNTFLTSNPKTAQQPIEFRAFYETHRLLNPS